MVWDNGLTDRWYQNAPSTGALPKQNARSSSSAGSAKAHMMRARAKLSCQWGRGAHNVFECVAELSRGEREGKRPSDRRLKKKKNEEKQKLELKRAFVFCGAAAAGRIR